MLKNVFKKSMAVLILLSMLFTNNGMLVYANSKPVERDNQGETVEFREVILDKFIDSLKIKKDDITKIEFKKGTDGDTLTDGIKVQYDNNDVYINIEDGVIVKLPTDSSEYFCGLKNLKEIKGLNLLDATNVKYAASMFEGPSKLKKLDLSSFSPNNLLETTDMFRNNAELEYINIENLDTSKVLDMVGMFNICPKLTTIDGISNMDTTSANSLDWVFYENKSMTTLDLTNWTVNSEISMSSCFVGCSELEKVYISDKWDENKRKIGSYINGTDGLSKIEFLEKEYKEDFDLGPLSMGSSEENTDFNETNDEKETNDTEIQISANNEEPEEDETREVVDDTSETVDTEETTETNEATETIESTAVNETTETTEVVGLNVDLSLKTENTAKKDVILNKFVNDLSIDKLFIKTINFVIGTEGEEIADGIRVKIDGSDVYINIEEGVNAKLPKDMSGYFSKMYSLEEVKGFLYLDATEVENMEEMFSTNNNLKRVDLTGLKTNNLLNAKNMFNNCPELTYINLGDLDTSKVENMKLMFSYCPKLEKIDGIENMKTDSVKNLDSIFEGDKSLTELNLSEWTIDENVSMVDSFSGLKKLETIYISNKWSLNRRRAANYTDGTSGLNNIKFVESNGEDETDPIETDNVTEDAKNETNNTNNTDDIDESSEKYIKDIKMVIAKQKTAEQIFENKGYTMLSKSLNFGTGGCEIYIGYATTTKKSEAITAIGERWFSAIGRNPESYIGDYHKYSYTPVTDFNGRQWDTNEGGDHNSKWVYLYISKDSNAGEPVKAIEVLSYTHSKPQTISTLQEGDTWIAVTNSNDNKLADFNRGTNADHVYIRYQK